MTPSAAVRRRASDVRWKRYWSREAPAIFIHINKTAGTSIIDALGQPHVRHATATAVRDLVGISIWEQKLTFSIVRNPYTRALSHYRYRCKHSIAGLSPGFPMDFETWFRAAYVDRDPAYMDNPQMFLPQYRWVADDRGDILVDEIGDFEELAESWKRIAKRLALNPTLPHKNQTTAERGGASELSTEAVELIAEVMADDFLQFGYSVDPSRRFEAPTIMAPGHAR